MIFSGSMRASACALGATLALGLGAATAGAAASGPAQWPQFRGADSRGVAEGSRFPDHWSTTENVAWKTPIPGRGWSSPIVWGDSVFVTAVVSDGELEPPKKGLYFGGDRKAPPSSTQHWMVMCLSLKDGHEVWRKEAASGIASTPLHLKNTYASETPVTDGKRVYAYFGNKGLFCYDYRGNLLWTAQWPVVKTRYGWGSAASPVLHGDRLFLVNDNEDQSFMVALNARSGKQLWRVERDEPSNWATPYIWKNKTRTELVTPGRKKVRSYDLEGRPLWELGGMSSIVIPTPFSEFGLLFVGSGYVGDKVRPMFAIKPGASGDISLPEGTNQSAFVEWSLPTAAPYNPSPLVYRDQLYVLFDFGFLSAHDARTGKQIYEKQRIRTQNTSFTASPWAANGKVYALSEDGDTYVFEAGKEYRLLHTNALDELCMSTPAIVGDRLLIRTFSQLYCIAPTRKAK